MRNTDSDFYGQQEDERILCVIRPHSLAMAVKLAKIYLIALFVFGAFYSIGRLFGNFGSIFTLISLLGGVAIAGIGSKLVSDQQRKNLAYLTDRRIVRFEPTNFIATNIRTLSWDEVVKVKTFSPNMIWKQMAIGSVVIHARSTLRVDEPKPDTVTADDIEIGDVYLYRDLGNYIDKILFTYKRMPREVANIRPFVPKPKGQRY